MNIFSPIKVAVTTAWIADNCKFATDKKQTFSCKIYKGSHTFAEGETDAYSTELAVSHFWFRAFKGDRVRMDKYKAGDYLCTCTPKQPTKPEPFKGPRQREPWLF